MSWFYLALLAPLLYAVVNLLDDNLLRLVYKGPYLAAAFTGFFGALPLLSRLFLHAASMSQPLQALSVMAGFLTVTYYFFYFKGLESDSPSIVIALFALAPATIPFFARFIVHEHLLPMEILGFVIVLVASAGLAVTGLRQVKVSKALVPVLIAVVFVDIISIATKYVYQKAGFYPVYMYFSIGMGLGGICFLGLKYHTNLKGLREIRQGIRQLLPVFVAAELLNLGAEFTLNLAISRGPVSLVKVIEGIQPMFVLLIALLLYPLSPKYFREAEEGKAIKKFILMGVTVAGLALISIAAKI